MYQTVEGNPRMTRNEAMERYPNSYILIQRDNRDTFDPLCIVLYIGDDFDELFSLQVDLPVSLGVVVEGINISSRLTLGDLVING